ncbi:50S ribosomal protein L3 [Patescibacteria group bacterium]|nr:50S ribosomal protein L3 [Patescibacteria group bacterium]
MISGFIIKKGDMTRNFREDGTCIPITKCQALPIVVIQVKTSHTKPSSVQFGYGHKKKLNNAILSKLKKLKIKNTPSRFIEFKLISDDLPQIGSEINFDSVFSLGELVDVTGRSKGRGFSGVIKRHGFHRQPVTRGQSDRTRAPGSIGAQTPGKVIKGKKMPGHFGNKQITVQNLEIIAFDKDSNQVSIKGDLPGHKNSWLIVKKQASAKSALEVKGVTK